MNLSDAQKVLITEMIDNIMANKDGINGLTEDSETKFNEIIPIINTIKAGQTVNFEELSKKIEAILMLESEAGNGSFVGAFGMLFSALNGRKETSSFTETVTSANGLVDVDISALGFASVGDYIVICQEVQKDGLNVTARAKKVSRDSVRVEILDNDFVSYADNPNRFFNASSSPVDINVVVIHNPTPLSATFNEVDGDVTTVGENAGQVQADTTAPDAPVVTSTTVNGNNTVTITGTTEAGASVKVVFPDASEATVTADGAGAFTATSSAAITADGNIVVTATDAEGNTSVETVGAYTAPAGGGNEL